MVLLIDANILLDVLMNRKDFVDDSSVIWKLCEIKKVKGYVSTLSFANLVYVMRNELNPSQIEEVIKKLSLIFEFTELNPLDISRAAKLRWNDFEDALQVVTALRLKVDYIVTRNIKDFSKSKISALTPTEIITRI